MSNDPVTNVLVISVESKLIGGLSQVTTEHDWHTQLKATVPECLRRVYLDRPELVLVQLTRDADKALVTYRLIQLLHQRGLAVVAVANTSESRDELEILSRQAGASAFLAADTAGPEFESVLSNVLDLRDANLVAAARADR